MEVLLIPDSFLDLLILILFIPGLFLMFMKPSISGTLLTFVFFILCLDRKPFDSGEGMDQDGINFSFELGTRLVYEIALS